MRVGLTGGLGSGKSTVAAMLRDLGAYILSADEMARKLMEPDRPVFTSIVERFGPTVLLPNGSLDRAALARIAFAEGKANELNALVHPATIALQGEVATAIFERDPAAIVVVESALIFETTHGGGWRQRFDKLVLVTAADATKVERFVSRSGGHDRTTLEAEAKRRLSQLTPDTDKAPECDFVLLNDGTLEQLRSKVDRLWQQLSSG